MTLVTGILSFLAPACAKLIGGELLNMPGQTAKSGLTEFDLGSKASCRAY